MFFVLQKIMWFLILPPASLLLLMLAGFVVMDRQRRAGRALIVFGIMLLYLLSLSHVADFILKPLERHYRPLTSQKLAADAVVVPGGGSVDLEWLRAEPMPNAETNSRLVLAVELAKKFRIPLIVTGGNGEPFSTEIRDADVMAAASLLMGFPARQLMIENQSRNTLENSHAVRKVVKGNRIILVTSAYYMRRAVAMFERRKFTVIPAPVYFLTQNRKCNLSALIPGAFNLMRSSTGIAEWVSMGWWHLRGEI